MLKVISNPLEASHAHFPFHKVALLPAVSLQRKQWHLSVVPICTMLKCGYLILQGWSRATTLNSSHEAAPRQGTVRVVKALHLLLCPQATLIWWTPQWPCPSKVLLCLWPSPALCQEGGDAGTCVVIPPGPSHGRSGGAQCQFRVSPKEQNLGLVVKHLYNAEDKKKKQLQIKCYPSCKEIIFILWKQFFSC